jgi:hypothetical protein
VIGAVGGGEGVGAQRRVGEVVVVVADVEVDVPRAEDGVGGRDEDLREVDALVGVDGDGAVVGDAARVDAHRVVVEDLDLAQVVRAAGEGARAGLEADPAVGVGGQRAAAEGPAVADAEQPAPRGPGEPARRLGDVADDAELVVEPIGEEDALVGERAGDAPLAADRVPRGVRPGVDRDVGVGQVAVAGADVEDDLAGHARLGADRARGVGVADDEVGEVDALVGVDDDRGVVDELDVRDGVGGDGE